MSAPERRSPCDCVNPEKQSHVHNWVVLLDDVDHPGGLAFLKALTAARETYRRRHGDRGTGDPLLVVATSGKWDGEWERELARAWRPPWQPDGTAARVVPSCRDASYDDWAEHPETARPSGYYPVLLEPLEVQEVADLLGEDVPRATAAFVHRASGGLPKAAKQLAQTLGDAPVREGARDVLGTSGPDPWRTWLADLRLSTVDTEALVTAAPFATAPWLVPLPEHGLVGQPHVGPILTELRASLWVNAPGNGGGTPDHVTLHPWLAGNLVSALARRNGGAGPTYAAQFTALRGAPGADDVRRAYCLLALGDFPAVVDLFERDFPELPHREWVDRLTVVVHAPDAQPLDEDYERLYGKLVDADVERKPGRAHRDPQQPRPPARRELAQREPVRGARPRPEPRHRHRADRPVLEVAALGHQGARRHRQTRLPRPLAVTRRNGTPMPRTALLDRLAPGNRPAGPPVRPRSLLHRHWIVVTVIGVLVLAAVIVPLRPWEQCGAGLTAEGDVCVGLSLESGPLRDDDPLAGLEAVIADRNAQAGAATRPWWCSRT